MSRVSAMPWARPAPVRLAPGERLLGAWVPTPRGLALRLYHLRLVALYGAILTAADGLQAWLQGRGVAGAIEALVPSLVIAAGVMILFGALAWGSARTTRYTLTDRRLVMQFGLALSATLNLPLRRIAAVRVRTRADGGGDITLLPEPGTPLAYLKLWPFARPWHFRAPEPMLRDVPAAGYVASVLTRMVSAARAEPAEPVAAPAERALEPA